MHIMSNFVALILLRRGRVSLCLHYTKVRGIHGLLMLVIKRSWWIRALYFVNGKGHDEIRKIGRWWGWVTDVVLLRERAAVGVKYSIKCRQNR